MQRIWEIISAIAVLLVFFGIMGWCAWRVIRKAEDPGWIIVKLVISGIILVAGFIYALSTKQYAPLISAVIFMPIGLWWAPQLGAAFASPLTSMFDGSGEEVEAKPFYSIVRA